MIWPNVAVGKPGPNRPTSIGSDQISPQSGQTRTRVGRACIQSSIPYPQTCANPVLPHPRVLANMHRLVDRVQLDEAWVGEIQTSIHSAGPTWPRCRSLGSCDGLRQRCGRHGIYLFIRCTVFCPAIVACIHFIGGGFKTNPLSIHARYPEPSLLERWSIAAVHNQPCMTKTKARCGTNSTAINMGSGCGI
ncbi:hypothetical protein MAPG_02670 [Magnaporthiopsis poae ATCC 64411]|uniref:Uncharacterized protein n=1 Tax=Magnaporthiopsis poae (strain ATCC 64411 / 73-15) TaxID=644358 RepID=A0A0C4DS01_MAGP6|nr:hypothetical protein MAPG_02670 [Magnaporthiopsis poae ATCC 64411]